MVLILRACPFIGTESVRPAGKQDSLSIPMHLPLANLGEAYKPSCIPSILGDSILVVPLNLAVLGAAFRLWSALNLVRTWGSIAAVLLTRASTSKKQLDRGFLLFSR